MTEVMLAFLVSSSILVVLLVSFLEPVECIFDMIVIMVNELVHWIHRHTAFAAGPRTRERSTCQICNNIMCICVLCCVLK